MLLKCHIISYSSHNVSYPKKVYHIPNQYQKQIELPSEIFGHPVTFFRRHLTGEKLEASALKKPGKSHGKAMGNGDLMRTIWGNHRKIVI